MANEVQRKQALDDIRENIARNRLHVDVVLGGPTRRCAYSIGLSESCNCGYKFSEVASLSSLKPADTAATISAKPPNKRMEIPKVTNK